MIEAPISTVMIMTTLKVTLTIIAIMIMITIFLL